MKYTQSILFIPILAIITACFQNPELKTRASVATKSKEVTLNNSQLDHSKTKSEYPNKISTQLLLTPEQEQQCVATYPTLKPESIVAGVTIAGVAGTATAYPNCSDTIKTNCITTTSHPAVKTEGLAERVLVGQTVAGVAGTAIGAKPDCTAANQVGCKATSTYRTMDLTNKDAGDALDLSSTSFEARVTSASVFEYWDESGSRHTSIGDGDIVASKIDTGVNVFGTDGSAVAPDCSSIPFGTWILVPGDPDYGTNDFCVMKYEAKCSLADGSTCSANASTESPTSTAESTPWVSGITQRTASMECASLGKGFQLITNDEWMTIAANAASVGSNWSGGAVGSGTLYRGHSDSSPGSVCAADSDDSKGFVETDCTAQNAADTSEDDTNTQRRTHNLTNGEVIWDLSGNALEWTSYFNSDEKPSPYSAWSEFTAISVSTTMPLSDLIPTSQLKSFWNDTWDSTNSIGKYITGSANSGGGLQKGGAFSYGDNAGIFSANMWDSPIAGAGNLGFRCTVAVP